YGINQQLDKYSITWHPQTAIGVVAASANYPEPNTNHELIQGLSALANKSNIKVFHGSSKLDNGQLYTCGGRVLCLTALDDDLPKARATVYSALRQINFKGMHYRRDIG